MMAASSSEVSFSFQRIPLVKQESTITIAVSLSDDSTPSLVSCHLTPPDDSPPVQCSVKESSQSGQYNIVFTPFTRGLHQLHVTLNNNNILGSPISVPVSVPPEMRGTPIKTITGLNMPMGIAVTDDGLVIVSECFSDCVTIFDREGKKIRSFGSEGKGMGQLQSPEGVAITLKGTILVSERRNHRLQEFTMEGDCISCVGTIGNGPLQFYCPHGIAINKTTGQVLVADCDNHRVQVLHPDLTFSHMFGSEGFGQGQFDLPQGVAVDGQGFIYVADFRNDRVQKFTPEGQFVASFGGRGSGPGQLDFPSGIAVDDNGLLYVYSDNDCVSVYTTTGQYINCIKLNVKPHFVNHVALSSVTFDSYGNLYISFKDNDQVIVF